VVTVRLRRTYAVRHESTFRRGVVGWRNLCSQGRLRLAVAIAMGIDARFL
jgi:hypothetical protein